jgi:hypothetical protein
MHTGPFRPGDRVPITGVYTVTHYQHRLPHDVFAIADDQFPDCRRCGKRVFFALSQSTVRIDADQDFAVQGKVDDLKAGSGS